MADYTPVDAQPWDTSTSSLSVLASKRRRNRRLKIGLFVLVLSSAITGFLLLNNAGWRETGPTSPTVSLDSLLDGHYRPQFKDISWLPDGSDGEFIQSTSDEWFLAKWPARGARRIVNKTITVGETERTVRRVALNKKQTHALVATDLQSNWRWSTFGRYWLVEIDSGRIEPLEAPVANGHALSIAQFSPGDDKVAFVFRRNVYVKDISSGDIVQVTKDGGAQIFNGIPDWVYEEEVFSGDSVMWWSPDGEYLAFMRTDESGVQTYPLEMYMNKAPHTTPPLYPTISEIKYPKAGTSNPVVGLWVYSVANETAREVPISSFDDKLITEVLWLSDGQIMVKSTDRVSDTLEVSLVDAAAGESKVVRTLQSGEQGGWFEITQNTLHVPADPAAGREFDGYIDTLVVDGYNHLTYFSPPDASEPIVLTRGEWELGEDAFQIDRATNEIYFTATKRSSTERHIYKVPLQGGEVQQVTPDEAAVFSAKLSPDGSHALVTYLGPNVPYQKVVKWSVETVADAEPIEENEDLAVIVEKLNLGDVLFYEHEVEPGVFVNVREIRPVGFSKYKRHPVLFFNYGGPNSQMVKRTFALDFQRVFAETHDAIVVTVDPRGTGFKGRDFRTVVRDRLGQYEAHDVIAVAEHYAKKRYVAEETITIWGWSYGGYLTLKTLEQDGGRTFKYGAAVAPVTDFRFYDSIYTERYMHTPQTNAKGYEGTAVSDVDSLSKATRFLIMHGTGDDNVHLQNTLALVDKLDEASVCNYDLHFYPDSNHAISFHNANSMVYHRLDQWLWQQHFHATNPDFDF